MNSKGLSITGWVVILMVFATVAYTILVSVSTIGAKVGAEYWRRSGYYVAARTADSITNIAYSDVDELLITMDLDDKGVEKCLLEIIPDSEGSGGMVYATVAYKGEESKSASRFLNPEDITVIDAKTDCGYKYLRIMEDKNQIGVRGE